MGMTEDTKPHFVQRVHTKILLSESIKGGGMKGEEGAEEVTSRGGATEDGGFAMEAAAAAAK